MKAESIILIIDFFKKHNIDYVYKVNGESNKFDRIIEFEIEGKTYFIEWWINQSYLKLENVFSSPHIPFKYILINTNSPNSIHKLQLCFFDELRDGDKSSMFYNPLPFGAFKIPFNIKK